MAVHQEEDAWGPTEDVHAAAVEAAGSSGQAVLNAQHSGTTGPGTPTLHASNRAPRISAQEEAWRLQPLLNLRLSPNTSTSGATPAMNCSSGGGGGSNAPSSESAVLPLQSLALGVVAKHVLELIAALGPEGCSWLPSEVKASLLAAARRRRQLTDDALVALSDPGFLSLDISGSRACGMALLQAAEKMPNLRALDITGCEKISSGCLKKLARLCPRLALLRLGGSAACSAAAAAALPHVVPAVSADALALAAEEGFVEAGLESELAKWAAAATGPGPAGGATEGVEAVAAAADSWEDLADDGDEESDGGAGSRAAGATGMGGSAFGTSSSSGGGGGRFSELRVIVWLDCPRACRAVLQRLCPRIVVNPALPKKGVLLGSLPREVDPAVPLDAAAFEAVGPAALEVGAGSWLACKCVRLRVCVLRRGSWRVCRCALADTSVAFSTAGRAHLQAGASMLVVKRLVAGKCKHFVQSSLLPSQSRHAFSQLC